eukprot:9638680-Alexandrium_andersonii.AAC.1
MSASLVGSEMCIRDRCLPQKAQRLQTRRIDPSHVFILGGADGRFEHSAVSYTHLTLPTICSV